MFVKIITNFKPGIIKKQENNNYKLVLVIIVDLQI